MTDKQIKLIIGSLLHDIGKVAYRAGDGRNHSRSGHDFLVETRQDFDKDILDCIMYHHGGNLKYAKIADNSIAYITYFADNIAAAADRRNKENGEDGFDKTIPLSSIFNILNGNNGNMHYSRQVLNPDADINYPTDAEVLMDKSFYDSVINNVKNNLKAIEISHDYINSLLSVTEANLMYIPSSTSKRELADISLYDHVKITAAIAECIYQYFTENNIDNYKQYLFGSRTEETWNEKMFLLYSADISGIQKFIYTISSKGALKGLRARSFYLDLIMEHFTDELLDNLNLSRSCLIYSGGGHCYILMPNTDTAKKIIEETSKEMNRWLRKQFGIELYLADGYTECSALQLKNEPEGSYPELYKNISRVISGKKSKRYTAEEIRELNSRKIDGERECNICRRTGKVDAEGRCSMCSALQKLSSSILYEDYFAVMTKPSDGALELPYDRFLVAADDKRLRKLMEQDEYVRSYSKNKMCTGKHVTTKLWAGVHNAEGETFNELADKAEGAKRIAVLRADVDNLGNAIVNGFKQQGGRYETLSRTAALSRQLSLFFKCYINRILENGSTKKLSKNSDRQLNIVYSGGDDVFLAGAWNDVIDAFTDIRNAFIRFTQGTLTISGGIGIYNSSHPINRMAAETEELEEAAKHTDGKDAVSLFDDTGTYKWNVYLKNVIGEKFDAISGFLANADEKGKVFVYKLLELLRENEDECKGNVKVKFNKARFVYYLSRLEPDGKEDPNYDEKYKRYTDFIAKMYKWSESAEERRQVITAIYLYVYLTRKKEETENE